jgi:hypothetical protein
MKKFLAFVGIAGTISLSGVLPAQADTATPTPVVSSQPGGEDQPQGENREHGIRIDHDFSRSEPIQFVALGAALTAAIVIAYGIGRRHRKDKQAPTQ